MVYADGSGKCRNNLVTYASASDVTIVKVSTPAVDRVKIFAFGVKLKLQFRYFNHRIPFSARLKLTVDGKLEVRIGFYLHPGLHNYHHTGVHPGVLIYDVRAAS